MNSGKVDQAKTQRLFYGWVVVAAAFCVALVAYGIQYSFGIFIDPLTEDFGWSVTLVSGAASLFMFSRGALAILTGWITDRIFDYLSINYTNSKLQNIQRATRFFSSILLRPDLRCLFHAVPRHLFPAA